MSLAIANDELTLPGVELVEPGEGALSERQLAEAQLGINRTNPYVPRVHGLELHSAWVLKGESPVGLVTVIDQGELEDGTRIAEIGARFWDRKSVTPGFLLDSFMEQVLGRYGVILVRCYWDNRALKRLLQRSGFRLARLEREENGRTVEVHVVSRSTYLGRHDEPYLEAAHGR